MEESYNFATTILTSKTPEQAAAIVPNVVAGSSGINKDLISWFNHYLSTLSTHNQNLKQLIDDADKIAKRSNVGFNNFPRNWNCLLKAVEMEHHNNEIIRKNLKLEIIDPLRNLIENDVRISELIVNGQELQEISSHLTKDGEYQWNYKAPQTFQNLEDFKKVEIQLMFNIVLNFFQMYNGKLTKELKNNENSTNYLLGSFKLDNEMNSQLDYLQQTQFQAPANNKPGSSRRASSSTTTAAATTTTATTTGSSHVGAGAGSLEHGHPKLRRMSSFGKLDKHHGASDEPSSPKKQSKLRSKVGSIFGRKNKKDKNQLNQEATIPEDASVSTDASISRTQSTSLLSRNTTRRSTYEPSSTQRSQTATAATTTTTNNHNNTTNNANGQANIPEPAFASPQYFESNNRDTNATNAANTTNEASEATSPFKQPLQPQPRQTVANTAQPQQFQQSQPSQFQTSPQSQQFQQSQPSQFQTSPQSQQFQQPAQAQQQQQQQQFQSSGQPRQSTFGSVASNQSKEVGQPSTPVHNKFLPPNPLPEQTVESPNFIKYNNDGGEDDDDDDDDDEDDSDESIVAGRRSSLLQRNELGDTSPIDHRNQDSYPTPHVLNQVPKSSLDPQAQLQQSQGQGQGQGHFQGRSLQPSMVPGSFIQNDAQRSRQSSDGIYSFETGDDQKPITAATNTGRNGVRNSITEKNPEQLPEPDLFYKQTEQGLGGASKDSESTLFTSKAPRMGTMAESITSANSSTAAPRPPPSRKVHHTDTNSSVRDSSIFHNLPAASTSTSTRDSFAAPASAPAYQHQQHQQPPPPIAHRFSSLGETQFKHLSTQDTGSLLKNDFKHFNLSEATSGLNASVAEIINANIKDGQVTAGQVVGEVAFNYNGPLVQDTFINVNIPYKYDKLIVNKNFIQELGEGNYTIDPSTIISKTSGGLKYLYKTLQVPLSIHQVWKHEPHQSSLLISIKSTVSENLVLNNFVVSAALNQDVQATSASSKPQGAFNKEKNRITWRYHEPVVLQSHGEEKLIARFKTNGQGAEHELGIQVKFAIEDSAKSIRYCTIYDAASGQEVPTYRNLISGHYSSHS